MAAYQEEFIDYAIRCGVLCFGDFILKSGRKSPYFFNAGLFNTGHRLGRLGEFYAEAILHQGLQVDVLYGPAYKGIPLVCAVAIALSRKSGQDIPFAFNRKEEKDHGERGNVIGAPLEGTVLIVDDVITSGISIRESVDLIHRTGATPAGVLIALDRQEKGQSGSEIPAIQHIEKHFHIPVYSLITLQDIIKALITTGRSDLAQVVKEYQIASVQL